MKIEIFTNKANNANNLISNIVRYLFIDEVPFQCPKMGKLDVNIILEIPKRDNIIEEFLNGNVILEWNNNNSRSKMYYSKEKNCFIYKWKIPNHTSLHLTFEKNDSYINDMKKIIEKEVLEVKHREKC
jgi:hypothetical protein